MRVRVQKWGNSLAIRIPKPFAAEAGVSQGGEVELAVSRGRLVVAPLVAPRYRLRELLASAVVAPEQFDRMLARLEQFVMPFAAAFQ